VPTFTGMREQVEQCRLLESTLVVSVCSKNPGRPYRLAGKAIRGVELDLLDAPAYGVIGDVRRQFTMALKHIDCRIDHLGDYLAEMLQARFHGGGACRAGARHEHCP
jgi:hypothetical protein